MQTPTHLIMTAALRYPLRRLALTIPAGALLLGAILPDLPFTLLTLGYELYYRLTGISVPAPSIMEYLHFDLFFNDPLWIVAHNMFHSLLVNGAIVLVGVWLRTRGRTSGDWLLWLGLSMQLHTLIDIFTHTSDGPLFLFPLNWQYRFESPVSYWESGIGFTVIEYTFNALLLAYILWQARRS